MITLKDLDLKKMSTEELGELLIDDKKVYYTTSKPIMDDHTYDTLEEILRQKNPHHRIFSKAGHPNFDTGFPKKKHSIPMGSQNKVNNFSDLIHYFELKKIPQNSEFIVQPKCDGLSLEIEYQNGQLLDAITRGDGKVGDIITQNVIKMKNFREKLNLNFTGSIRCEIVVTKTDFQKLNKIVSKKAPLSQGGISEGEGGFYSNPRNAASGISQRLDSLYSNYCTLVAVDLITPHQNFSTETKELDYIKKLKGKTADEAVKILLSGIKKSLKKAGIKFDVWFSEEKNLRKKGELKKVLELLNKKKLLKERGGALWLGDAVAVKSNQEYTYFLADLAYHYDKFIKRKFDLVINIWGADHHGYVARMQKGAEALSVNPARLKIIIMQLVRLISQGKEVKMSKRAGEFITLDDLLKEVGLDAARWFFLERSPDTHMDFDLDLAKERSKKNPVYYVQYAHARACSILRKGKAGKKPNLQLLIQPEEFTLIKKILQLSEIIEDITGDFQVHRLTRYVYELAQAFTNFYEKQHVIDKENKELTQARLALVSATQKTIKNGLNLLGISAPEKM